MKTFLAAYGITNFAIQLWLVLTKRLVLAVWLPGIIWMIIPSALLALLSILYNKGEFREEVVKTAAKATSRPSPEPPVN